MRYPTVAQIVDALPMVLGTVPVVRDHGLLESAIDRPATSVLGHEPFATVWEKAAAGLHGVVTNHPLVDGNKRAGWFVANVLLELNGATLDGYDTDQAEALVLSVAAGEERDVVAIAAALKQLA